MRALRALRVRGSGSGDQGPGIRVRGSGSWDQGPGIRVLRSGSWDQGPGIRVRGSALHACIYKYTEGGAGGRGGAPLHMCNKCFCPPTPHHRKRGREQHEGNAAVAADCQSPAPTPGFSGSWPPYAATPTPPWPPHGGEGYPHQHPPHPPQPGSGTWPTMPLQPLQPGSGTWPARPPGPPPCPQPLQLLQPSPPAGSPHSMYPSAMPLQPLQPPRQDFPGQQVQQPFPGSGQWPGQKQQQMQPPPSPWQWRPPRSLQDTAAACVQMMQVRGVVGAAGWWLTDG